MRLVLTPLLALVLVACGKAALSPGGDGGSGGSGNGGAGGTPRVEICNNNDVDDDGNGLADCKDSACVSDPHCKPRCGDKILGLDEFGKQEACDGADLGNATCVSRGFNAGGVLACNSDCSMDESGCNRREDCGSPGDEDQNGLADCADPACATLPRCLHVTLVSKPTSPVVTTAGTVSVMVTGGTVKPVSGLVLSLLPPPGAAVDGPATTDSVGTASFQIRLGRMPGPQVFTVTTGDDPSALQVEVDTVDAAPLTIHSVVNVDHTAGQAVDGAAIKAQVAPILDLQVASDGTLYLAQNCQVLSVSPAGVLAPRAGTGNCGAAADGPALATDLEVAGLVLDEAHDLLFLAAPQLGDVATSGRVLALDLARGTLTTVAGGGDKEAADSDGGLATAAALDPRGLALDPSGLLYVADGRSRSLRRVSGIDGTIVTVVRAAPRGGPCEDVLDVASCSTDCKPVLDAYGVPFLAAPLCGVQSGASVGDSTDGLVRLDRSLVHVAGFALGPAPTAGPATLALLPGPLHGAFDPAGNLVGATGDSLVRIDGVTGRVETLAGGTHAGASGENQPLSTATFSGPQAAAFGPGGDLYLADTDNASVRRIVGLARQVPTSVTLEAVSGGGQSGLLAWLLDGRLKIRVRDDTGAPVPGEPVQMIASDPGATVLSGGATDETGAATIQVRLGLTVGPHDFSAYLPDIHGKLAGSPARFTLTSLEPPQGTIVTAVGMPDAAAAVLLPGQLLPGPSTGVDVRDVAVTSDGTAYLSVGPQVLALRPDGALQLVAGTGVSGRSGDGGFALDARISALRVAVEDATQTLYFGDQGGEPRVRAVSLRGGTIQTFAGGGPGGDGVPATSASLGSVSALAVGKDGSLYIGDDSVRRVEPLNGTIETTVVAGPCGDEDGLSGSVTALALDGDTLYISGTVCQGGNALPGVLRRDPDSSLHYVAPIWGYGMAVAADHSLLLGGEGDPQTGGAVLSQIDPVSGVFSVLAGGGKSYADWVPATQTELVGVRGLALRPDGNLHHLLLISDGRLRLVW